MPSKRSPATNDSKICVLGLGYIGLPTSAVLASRGYQVHGVDVEQHVIDSINSGETHIVEPDLDILVQAAVQTGRLKAHQAPVEADVFIICVPTPLGEGRTPDVSFVEQAMQAICPVLRTGNLVILESTSPPGTTESLMEIVRQETGLNANEYRLAHAPERVLPGRILREVVENDRIIGGVDDDSTEAARAFYATFVAGELFLTSARMAEMVKLVENSFRDVNVAFANELSVVCDELDLDVWELVRLANRHPRVNILRPGPGVGGHCLAVDPWFIVDRSPSSTRLIRTAREVNEAKPEWVAQRILRRAERFKRPTIACLGLAYKPNIDDLRESPALAIVRAVAHAKPGELRVVEPNLASHPEFDLMTADEALDGADIVVFLVAHRQFMQFAPNQLAEKTIIDICGALRP